MTIATPPPTTLSTPSPTERSNADTSDEQAMSSQSSRPIYLIVATCLCSSRLGIGYRNKLPWPLIKSDTAFFQKVTRDSRPPSTSTTSSNLINAVVMGRKTYESIPPKYRPLGGRLNVVISRTPPRELSRTLEQRIRSAKHNPEAPELKFESHALDTPQHRPESVLLLSSSSIASSGVSPSPAPPVTTGVSPATKPAIAPILLSSSLPSALSVLNTSTTQPSNASTLASKLGKHVGNIFIIGGSEMYSASLQHSSEAQSSPLRILQTEVRRLDGEEFECDTFFPVALGSEDNNGWTQVSRDASIQWLSSGFQDGEQMIQHPLGDEEWARDEKAGVEVRVVGWQKRPA